MAAALEALRRTERPTLLVVGEPGARARAARRVGLVSGSFDPPTVGHVALVEAAADRCDLVVLVYSVRTLPKEGPAGPPLLSEEQRLEALERIRQAGPGRAIGLCSHGLLADQATAAGERLPNARLWLVMGSDKALQLLDPRWYQDRDVTLQALFARARVLYAERTGQEGAVETALERPGNARWRSGFDRLATLGDVAQVSSRQVRERLRRGEDVRSMVPREVLPLLPAPEARGLV